MGIQKATLQVWLREWREGTLPFDAPVGEDSYCQRIMDGEVNLQAQLRAAFALREMGIWDDATYQDTRSELEQEHNVRPETGAGEVSSTFSPWAPIVQKQAPLPTGWEVDENGCLVCVNPDQSTMTGAVSEDVTGAIRSKTGRFRDHVAELWWYDPETGIVRRQCFTNDTTKEKTCTFTGMGIKGASPNKPHTFKYRSGPSAIAKAWRRAQQLQDSWSKLGVTTPCVWVKYRMGECDGNRWVFLSDAAGLLLTPQGVVNLHAQAKAAGIKASVGERMSKISNKVIQLMLDQNNTFFAARVLQTTDGEPILDEDLRLTIETPCVEPGRSDEIVYSILFQSGEKRMVTIHPLADDKDEDGNVIVEGHRVRAYRLLLDSPSGRCDAPQTIKWVVYGKDEEMPQVFVTGRRAALEWAERNQGGDEEIAKIEAECLDIRKDTSLVTVKPGKASEYVARKGKRLNQIDPAEPKRAGPAMHNPPTRVDYVDGRHFWGKAKNSDSPGARWVGGMGYLEAQLYNMA